MQSFFDARGPVPASDYLSICLISLVAGVAFGFMCPLAPRTYMRSTSHSTVVVAAVVHLLQLLLPALCKSKYGGIIIGAMHGATKPIVRSTTMPLHSQTASMTGRSDQSFNVKSIRYNDAQLMGSVATYTYAIHRRLQ